MVQKVLDGNQKAAADYRGGKEKALHSLKGMVMRETRGKANPAAVEELLLELMDGT